jgi:DNA-binding MarR family transcriptional regulator
MSPRAADDSGLLDSSNLEHVIGFLLAIATTQTRAVFQRHLGTPFDLRPVEYTLLELLLGNDSVSPKRLARSLRMPAPNVTVLIDRMVARGLVERRRSRTDGRALQVLLTADGRVLAQRAHEVSLTMEDGLLQSLSPAERAMLRELLLKLARAQP